MNKYKVSINNYTLSDTYQKVIFVPKDSTPLPMILKKDITLQNIEAWTECPAESTVVVYTSKKDSMKTTHKKKYISNGNPEIWINGYKENYKGYTRGEYHHPGCDIIYFDINGPIIFNDMGLYKEYPERSLIVLFTWSKNYPKDYPGYF
ncbi:MAG: hypothetical protein ACOCRK_03760 [bacterium]